MKLEKEYKAECKNYENNKNNLSNQKKITCKLEEKLRIEKERTEQLELELAKLQA